MTAPGQRGVFQNCFMSEHVFTWCHDGLSIMWFLKQSFQTMTCFTICATMIFYIRWFWPQAERRKSKFCKGSLEAAACKGPGLGSLVSLDCIALPIVAGAKKWMGSEPASEPESSVSSESLISRHLFATSNRVAAIQHFFFRIAGHFGPVSGGPALLSGQGSELGGAASLLGAGSG